MASIIWATLPKPTGRLDYLFFARPPLGGLIVGLLVAYLGAGVLDALLFRVQPRDSAVYAAVVFLLITVAFVAPLVPAYRAGHVDPIRALRED
jgi:ABC-type antimicrobial peptide transport system permease subunit